MYIITVYHCTVFRPPSPIFVNLTAQTTYFFCLQEQDCCSGGPGVHCPAGMASRCFSTNAEFSRWTCCIAVWTVFDALANPSQTIRRTSSRLNIMSMTCRRVKLVQRESCSVWRWLVQSFGPQNFIPFPCLFPKQFCFLWTSRWEVSLLP